jgi:CHAT domain
MLDQILAQIQNVDSVEIIQRFDADFDASGQAATAVGLLRLVDALAPAQTRADLAVRVGAYWCALIDADVRFDLGQALALLDESEADAADLAGGDVSGSFPAYCLARWYDGSGKVLYRIGSHARGRMNFALARATARDHDLWWCRADLESNWLRGRLEEARQAGAVGRGSDAARAVTELEEAVRQSEATASERGIRLGPEPVAAPGHQDREHMRGHSSLLHNLSFAVMREDPARSLALSRQAAEISAVLHDSYRLAQALNHQGLVIKRDYAKLGLQRSEADQLFQQVQDLGWPRHRHIAQQQLAQTLEPRVAAQELAGLLRQIDQEAGRGGRAAGLDVDLRWFTVDAFEQMASRAADTHPGDEQAERLLRDALAAKLAIARSVRRVIALPAYKRAYGSTVRPAYSQRIGRILGDLAASGATGQDYEDVVSLVEESTGRELLDLISSVDLPTMDAPPSAAAVGASPVGAAVVAQAAGTSPADVPSSAPADGPVTRGASPTRRRRAPVRRASAEEEAFDRAVLMEREREFEQQFLTRPLQAAPHDEEIARRATMFAANHPGTRFVRYFARGWLGSEPEELGAFVIGETISDPIQIGPLQAGKDLVVRLLADGHPTADLCRAIWETLLAPVWPAIGEDVEHLVVVPTDDLFAVPFHIAADDPEMPGALPLAARTAFSQAVSLTAFLTRGRHLLRRQRTSADDDLAAVIIQDGGIKATEIVGTGWDMNHVYVTGDVPDGLEPGYRYEGEADWAGLHAVTACRPEFFVYAGHGNYVRGFGELGPYLQLRSPGGGRERLTPYDVALRLRLPRNILTIVGACLAGQGASTAGGDVSGFLRSFMAAGAGSIGLPLWPVDDEYMADTSRYLLRTSRPPEGQPVKVFDVVQALHQHYREIASVGDWWERMPLVLYT